MLVASSTCFQLSNSKGRLKLVALFPADGPCTLKLSLTELSAAVPSKHLPLLAKATER